MGGGDEVEMPRRGKTTKKDATLRTHTKRKARKKKIGDTVHIGHPEQTTCRTGARSVENRLLGQQTWEEGGQGGYTLEKKP